MVEVATGKDVSRKRKLVGWKIEMQSADVLRVIRESQVVVANELLSILHVPSEIEALIPVDLEEPAQLGLGTLFTSS